MALQLLTNVSIAFIYRDAAFKSEATSQTHLGETLEVLEDRGDWLRVRQEDKYEGWVARFFVIDKPASWENHTFYYHGEQISWIFQSPDTQSNTIRDITLLSRLPLLDQDGGWVQLLLPDGVEGWVQKSPRPLVDSVDVERLIQTAFGFQGIQYFWGGRSPKGFDCSGFVQTVYGLNGLRLPRDAYLQADVGTIVDDDFSNWEVGDLIFFTENSDKITHVAISLGQGDFIHASGFVKMNSMNADHPDLYLEKYEKTYTRTIRVI
ncbi:MAG: C40 family peptidase [FCB group bacterium]|nr:C40 family peptidase [FCB group bacterium]MBL7028490.1 C40 family peptidase [Candidatus Neomarinimicrobiota bacterium]MBL7121554.1 C40 family peptidase [Candidatus Neomarinimicrobiota bacterium]